MAKKTTRTTKSGKGSSRQQFYLLGGVVVVSVLVLAAILLVNQEAAGETKKLDEYKDYAGIPVGGEFANVRTVERGSDVVEGVEMGIKDDGIPYIGSLDAPIVLGEFADFTCPHCATYHSTISQLIRDFVRNGQLRIEFYPMPAPTRAPASQHSARASLCAARQGAFWEMHDELFRIQQTQGVDEFTPDDLSKVADSMGLDGDELRACMNSNQADAGIATARRLALDLGVDSTPTVIYRLNDSLRWNTFPSQGGIGGGRPYDTIASLVRQVNDNAGG
ncbi:MAG: thioredoxin domain-containing protein [Anaerolineae bacterium]|nr:thioredoxin domain-containing protein [Anaerolineae bacterium]